MSRAPRAPRALLLALLAGCAADTAGKAALGDDTGDGGEATPVADPCGEAVAEGWTEASHAKGVDGDHDRVFDDSRVLRLDLVFCASDREAQLSDLAALLGEAGTGGGGPGGGGPGGGGPGGGEVGTSEDPTYVPVTVAVDGQTWPSVGIRYKGNSSLSRPYATGSMKLPFRLDFDHYEDEVAAVEDQRFWGFKELKFSNADLDGSLMRDKLTSDTLRAAGIPAAKGTFVEVWADAGDGEGPVYWGLYSMFEDPAGELLDAWFGDDDGSMYKADGDAATLADGDLTALQQGFEGKGGDEDHADLQALVVALNDDTKAPEAWRADLEAVLDVDGVLSWMALDALVGNWDGYGQMTHNYYLYADPGQDGRFVFVPWDFNEAYRRDGTRAALSVSRDEVGESWPLIRRLLDDPVYAERYRTLLATHMDGAFEVGAQQEAMATAHALLAASAEAEAAPYTNLSETADFETALEGGEDSLYDILDTAHELGWAVVGG